MIHSPITKVARPIEVGTASASMETLKVRDTRAAAMQEAACRSLTITKRDEDLLAHHSQRNAETTHFTGRKSHPKFARDWLWLSVACRAMCIPNGAQYSVGHLPHSPPEKRKRTQLRSLMRRCASGLRILTRRLYRPLQLQHRTPLLFGGDGHLQTGAV